VVTDEGTLGDLDYCYLTTTGRHTGSPHRIEIWFAIGGAHVYLLSGAGDHSDWVRNLMISPEVVVEIGDWKKATDARVVSDPEEDAMVRRLLVEKYQPRYRGDLTDWGKTSLPVAIDWT
jgi:deazaflavin-dependent oxidoreductase (nitroreductase family)